MPPLRVFCSKIGTGLVVLSPEESHHVATVLRAKPGQTVVLFDGLGNEAVGTVTDASRRKVLIDVGQVVFRPLEMSWRITVAVAMPKTHRQGYLIEKCTELGAVGIWAILAQRGVTRPRPGAIEKWFRRAVEAAKQADRAWVPQIDGPLSLDEAIQRVGRFDAVSLTHTGGLATPFLEFLAAKPSGSSVLVFVGPEGGWTETEVDQAVGAGAVQTSLGPTVLRTETAAVAVCAIAAACSCSSPRT